VAFLLGGGLEPRFRVLFSAIFHSIAQGDCHQRGKQWKVVEAKLLQNAASLRTFFVLVIGTRSEPGTNAVWIPWTTPVQQPGQVERLRQ
jgi:hypothetical protein